MQWWSVVRLARVWTLGLSLLCVAPSALAEGSENTESPPSVNVLEGWRFRWGDSPLDASGAPSWATEESGLSGWTPMKALTVPPGRDGRDFLWIRMPVPAGTWQAPTLDIENVMVAFEVYGGGKRLYSSGELRSGGATPLLGHWGDHLVPLSPALLGQEVFLRIQSMPEQSIGVTGGVRLGSQGEVLLRLAKHGLLSLLLGATSLGISLIVLVFMFRRRNVGALLAFSLFLLTSGVLLIGISGLHDFLWFAPRFWRRALIVATLLLAPSLVSFVLHTLTDGASRWQRRTNLGLWIVSGVLTLLSIVNLELSARLTVLTMLVFLVGSLLSVGLTVQRALQGSLDARLILGGVFVLTALGVHDTFVVMRLTQSTTFLISWGFAALGISLGATLGRRFGVLDRELAVRTTSAEAQHQELRDTYERMREGASELLVAVRRLREVSERQNAGLEQQAAALAQTQATAAEIHETSKLAANKSTLAASTSGRASDAGQRSAQTLEQSLAGLGQIRAQVEEMTQRIGELQRRTREIAGIVDTVKGLADASNMLALNAAIEAVRSGEAGKGFAVVAREIRALADQSILATGRIREVLGGLGREITELGGLGEQSTTRVQANLDQLASSGAELAQISGLIQESNQSVRQIDAAVTQQDAGITQIFTALNELSNRMHEAITLVRQTEDATQAIHRVAWELSAEKDASRAA